MKTIIALIGVAIVMGIGFYLYNQESVNNLPGYVKEQVTEVTEEPKEQWQTDEDAIKAAKAVVRKKELEAQSKELQSQIDELKKQKIEVDKELGTFWRDKENVKRLIREAFPENPTVAIAVANCESGLNPNAHNPHNGDGSVDGGLWQINSVHDKRLEQLGLDKYNPEDATKFARMLYEERGFRDWVCYTHNKIVLR